MLDQSERKNEGVLPAFAARLTFCSVRRVISIYFEYVRSPISDEPRRAMCGTFVSLADLEQDCLWKHWPPPCVISDDEWATVERHFVLIHSSNGSKSLIRSFHPTVDEQVSSAAKHWSDWKYLFADVEVIRSRRCSADASLAWLLAMSHPRICLKNTRIRSFPTTSERQIDLFDFSANQLLLLLL